MAPPSDENENYVVHLKEQSILKQESVRPRWPYDMRPSVRAEKYIRDGWRKDVTDGNNDGTDGQTDRQTDRQSATQYAAPS